MKIAYFTPLSPAKSGIADFADEILPYLMKKMDIDIYTENFVYRNNEIWNKSIFRIKDYDKKYKEYDLNVFQIGNNYIIHKEIVDKFLKLGGIVELHDVSLQHYILQQTKNKREEYIKIMEYCHGDSGRKYAELFVQGIVTSAYENHCLEYPVCKFLIDKAQGVIVHSDFAKQMVKGMNCNCRVINIPLHTLCGECFSKQKYKEDRKKLAIEEDTFVIGSFGLVSKGKRVDKVIEALGCLKKIADLKYKYYIIGQVEDESLLTRIEKLGLSEKVIIKGYVEKEKFSQYINACDLCINLRYPTQGESSASLQRLLGAGKITLVSNVGAFKEYPDDIVRKISIENEVEDIIYHIIEIYYMIERDKVEKRVFEYAKRNFDVEKNANSYYNYFYQILDNRYEDEYIDKILDEYFLKNGNYNFK